MHFEDARAAALGGGDAELAAVGIEPGPVGSRGFDAAESVQAEGEQEPDALEAATSCL
jgi:hypothetical protein